MNIRGQTINTAGVAAGGVLLVFWRKEAMHMPKVNKRSPWKAPKTKSERRKRPASHFLMPKERKFPYRTRTGAISCAGLRAAITRAAQHGYKNVEAKARRLYNRYCKKDK